MTPAELAAARLAAGAAYADAAAAYTDAWVELHALDRLAERLGERRGLAGLPALVGHPQFLDPAGLTRDPAARSDARLAELAAELEI